MVGQGVGEESQSMVFNCVVPIVRPTFVDDALDQASRLQRLHLQHEVVCVGNVSSSNLVTSCGERIRG